MSNLRTSLAAIVLLLLAAGYAASQWFYLQGRAAEYAAKVDQPQIALLATLILFAAVLLCFVRVRDERRPNP